MNTTISTECPLNKEIALRLRDLLRKDQDTQGRIIVGKLAAGPINNVM